MARATSGVPVDLRSISLAFSKAKWRNRDFSYSKAYVCSVFSQWAYAAVSQFDLDQTAQLQRFGMFHASAVFRSLIRTPRKHYFENFIRKQSLEGEGPQ